MIVLRAILALGRFSYLPTVWSNCLAGWWLGGGGHTDDVFFVLAGATCLWAAGAVLNDAFDLRYDRQHRRTRPIPAGLVGVKVVWRAGLILLVTGTFFLFMAGYAAGELGLALRIASADSPRWNAEYEDLYQAPPLMIPWYASLGNHDNRGKADAEIAYSKLSPRWRMPARYYSQTDTIDGTHEALFVHLDTSPFVASYRKKGPSYHVQDQDPKAQARWLQSVLAASRARWKLVVGHHPIYAAAGAHGDTKELVAQVLPLLEEFGVQAYFCGHDHVLQHLVHGKINFFVCGGGRRIAR